MFKFKVLVLIFAIVNVVFATLGSDLDEDDFRSLKGVENDGEDDENDDNLIDSAEEQKDEEDSRVFYNKGLFQGWTST